MAFSNGTFFSANDFYRSVFGKKVYKVSVSSGCTCPNRDGTKGWGGCVFCSESGSGDFIKDSNAEIEVQLKKGIELISSKIKEPAFIAYFQSFSNTYGDTEKLLALFKTALSIPGVVGLAIGTRPDCLGDEILHGIAELSKNHFISIELGLQTTNDKSVEYINRCYPNKEYAEGLRRLKKLCPSVHVVTHVIFGLPGESEKDMLSTVDYAVQAGTDGIKISVLHVLRGTKLCHDYENGMFECMSMEEYFSVLGKAILRIPENIVIHRVTGDGPKKILVSPLWTADKKKVLNSMTKYFKENSIVQGAGFLKKMKI